MQKPCHNQSHVPTCMQNTIWIHSTLQIAKCDQSHVPTCMQNAIWIHSTLQIAKCAFADNLINRCKNRVIISCADMHAKHNMDTLYPANSEVRIYTVYIYIYIYIYMVMSGTCDFQN
jgi:hypothetical protein